MINFDKFYSHRLDEGVFEFNDDIKQKIKDIHKKKIKNS